MTVTIPEYATEYRLLWRYMDGSENEGIWHPIKGREREQVERQINDGLKILNENTSTVYTVEFR
jgi:hypothetical protein